MYQSCTKVNCFLFTVLFLYWISCRYKWLCAFVPEESAMDCRFGLINWVRLFRRVERGKYKAQRGFYQSFLWRMVECSFVLWFPEKYAGFNSFFRHKIFLVTLILTNRNAWILARLKMIPINDSFTNYLSIYLSIYLNGKSTDFNTKKRVNICAKNRFDKL